MPNEAQREVWSAEDMAGSWARTEPISDYGTAPIMEFLGLSAGERVLDVACGGGRTTVAAARAVKPSGHVTGVDISEGMVALASCASSHAGTHRNKVASTTDSPCPNTSCPNTAVPTAAATSSSNPSRYPERKVTRAITAPPR